MNVKRFAALLLSLVLLCTALPAMAKDKGENNIIGAAEIQRYYSTKIQEIKLGYYTKDGADISYTLTDSTKTAYITKSGYLVIPAYYVGVMELIVTAGETSSHYETEKYVEIYIFPRATTVKLTATSTTAIHVSWTKISEAKSYVVYYATKSNFKNAELVYVKKSKTSVDLKNLTPGKTYYVKVRTLGDADGYSYTDSDKKSVKLKNIVPVISFSVYQKDAKTNLSGKTISLKLGKQYTVYATNFSPSNATTKSVKWTSSNSDVASISSSGVITALLRGTTTITATSKDSWGAKLSFKVKVK